MMTKTLKSINGKQKWVLLNQYSTIKIHQRLYGTIISIIYKMGEKNRVIHHIYVTGSIYLLFYDEQDTGYEYCEIQASTSQLIFTYKNISKDI